MFAPSEARVRAMARPREPDEPVTRAVRFERRLGIAVFRRTTGSMRC